MTTASAVLQQVTIASAELEVVVLPGVGARLHRLRAFGIDVLHAPQSLRRLLDGQPGAMTTIPPGANLEHTIEISFDRRTPAGLTQPTEV
jgi:galactose mutarotase-like enzyme